MSAHATLDSARENAPMENRQVDGWWVPADIAAITPPRSRPTQPCRHPDGCGRAGQHGYCARHLAHLAIVGDFALPAIDTRAPGERRCHHPDGCPQPHKVHGLCGRHHQRLCGIGLLGGPDDLHRNNTGTCTHPDGCPQPALTRELCKLHYDRWKRRDGDLGKVARYKVYRHPSHCDHPGGCPNPPEGHGLCAMHHGRLRRGTPLGPARRYFTHHDAHLPCLHPACPNPITPTGWCPIHGPNAPDLAALDERRTNFHGYVLRSTLSGPRQEHRLIVAALEGRLLQPCETVHHRNGVRHDNRPHNLELWVTAHGAGQRVEDLARWVVTDYPLHVREALIRPRQRHLPSSSFVSPVITARHHLATGYVDARIHTPTGAKWMREHRAVMAAILGRPLRRGENVHHLNGIRHDNTPGNLELWTRPQCAGQRVDDLIDWILHTYPDEVAAAMRSATAAVSVDVRELSVQ